MVIKDTEYESYIEPLKKMFPKGVYWDKLLSDENSDISLVCKARAATLSKFRARMNQLLKEANLSSADETISDWERIYSETENNYLPLENRRALLSVQKNGGINVSRIRDIAEIYDGSFHNWEIPYTPAAFGHAQFGLSCMSSVAGMWVVFIYASVPEKNRKNFEQSIRKVMLANQKIFFVYGD